MKKITTNTNEKPLGFLVNRLNIKCFIFSLLILIGIQVPLMAQDAEYTKPSFRFGLAAGGNFNFYTGTTQRLNQDLTVPTAFRQGNGIGLYVAPLIEYHRPGSLLGVMLQAGYDSRRGSFDQVMTPCNCEADLKTELSYITIEPSLRFAPFRSSFYIYAGPRFAFNMEKAFTYSQKANADFPEQEDKEDVNGDFSNMNSVLLSMQIGAGYDIELSSKENKTQYVISPFVAFHPYIGQEPRSIETWNVTTLRAGVAFKIGSGQKIDEKENTATIGLAEAPSASRVKFSVISPENIPVERRVRETFPLRNYVFFDMGSNNIPERYVLLTKDQVKDFKEDQLEVFTPKKLSGRSERAMVVYYNLINIVGDRMGKNPQATITLVGSSETSNADGRAMAESVKQYLTSVFSIDPARIKVEGREKPKVVSGPEGGTMDLALLSEDDRRVSIESNSPAMLMEFQSGPEAPLKPVQFEAVQIAPLDSYITFIAEGSNKAFSSWSVETEGKNGEVKYFGPFNQEKVSIPGKSVMGTRPEGEYKVTMVGKTNNNEVVKEKKTVNMVLWTPAEDEIGMRYSVIYEFNESKSIRIYEKYLTEIVAPKIPANGKVIIHGYSDKIGDKENNKELSEARANDVRQILKKALAKAGKKDVRFEVYGFGEDTQLAPFDNELPEGRFYNRTVVIDIIPNK
ncbi:OmpA family protein [Marivirga sp. S37H4]|uniref:OmpA family protein n=1 Tax=Marivirga aurantiaca TaxID=2802615 RepID=A0A934X1L2_9BACT|nr:OmpA family protein [Marivirga aurantiaca]MBK6266715.1 OmpA family protein [Marivirga aurantiaca]